MTTVDFLSKIFLIFYPSLENYTTGIAITPAQGLFYFTIFYQYRFPLSQSHQSVHCLSVVEREYFILALVHHNVDQNIFEIVFEFNKPFIPRYFLTVFQIKLVINW